MPLAPPESLVPVTLGAIPVTMGSCEITTNAGAASKLRKFLDTRKDILLCPGVYDGFSTRIALSVGFEALHMVSIPVSKSCHF
jgi:hypothetical protein